MREYTKYALQEVVGWREFEDICTVYLYCQHAYTNIRQAGRIRDGGRDAVVVHDKEEDIVFAFSMEEDPLRGESGKFYREYSAWRDKPLKKFVFVSSQDLGARKIDAPKQLSSPPVEIYDVTDLVRFLELTSDGRSVKQTYGLESPMQPHIPPIDGGQVESVEAPNLPSSLSEDSETARIEHHQRVAVALSDFAQYLDQVSQTSAILELPNAIRSAFDLDLRRVPADQLYSFQVQDTGDYGIGGQGSIPYGTFFRQAPKTPALVIGESGIGKTSFLEQMLYDQAQMCLEHSSNVIPVLIKLGQFSPGRQVLSLITEVLISRGAIISSGQLPYLLRDGRLALLFDAFDEVLEPHVPEVERELQSLIDDYPKSRIIVTTRHFRLPRLSPMKRFQLQPLSYDRVEAFARMYLDPGHQAFLWEISAKGLGALASNTLLLTLLILLYLREGELPRSRGQILQGVADRVRDWDRHKPERFGLPLSRISWGARVQLLAKLAFSSLSIGESYALDKNSVEMTLIDTLNDLERRRQIPSGLTLDEILDSLAATGFIVRVAEGVLFWHRAFVEHFAASELASRLETSPELLEDLIKDPEWEHVLPLAAAKARDPSGFIEKVLNYNVLTAGRALSECNLTEGYVCRRIVDGLTEKCNSQTRPIRQIAIDLLRQLDGTYVDAQFQKLLDSEFVHVQKAALVEVARRKIPRAREIVFSRLDWDVRPSIWLEGPSGTAVIEALGQFDDAESHLQIISIWRERPDHFTTEGCRSAFLKIARRGNASDDVKTALLDFFLLESDDVLHGMKLWELSEVLVALGDSKVVPRLLSAVKQTQQTDGSTRGIDAARVLASFDEPGVIQQLVDCVNDQNLSDYARVTFAQALSNSRGGVPLHVFEALAQDDNDDVKSYGIRGCGRFSFLDVGAIVLHAVHPPRFEESLESGFSFAPVQAAALEVLADHGKIELLLEGENRPEYFYSNSLEALFNAISRRHLYSMIPLLEAIAERISDDRSIIKAAWVLADLGQVDHAREIIETIRRTRLSHGWVAHDIVNGIHRLPASYALEVVDEVLRKAEETKGGGSRHLRRLCVEALVMIGTSEACERLAQIAWASAEDGVGLDAELALRGIEFLGPREKESWLLKLIREHPRMEHYARRRALETLGVIGTHDSVPLLQEFFKDPHPTDVQVTCFWAIHNIHKRAGYLWFNEEEKA